VPDVTDLLNRWSTGDSDAFDLMVPLVYDDLKRVARRALNNEHQTITLDCTVLVHEAYLRLVDQSRMQWNGRAHFFGAAAQVMRRILVDHARERLSSKRGANAQHQPLDNTIVVALQPDFDVVALHEALEALAAADPESARVVELRCFGGLTVEETAEVMNVSPSAIDRLWSFARAWLYRRLHGDCDAAQSPATAG
jgi:RNA polymerase sigma factor (TIGR02999 family)